MSEIALIFLIPLYFIGCFLQLTIYPFYWIIVYADIIYLSIIAFFILMIVGFYILKNHYRYNHFSIALLVLSGIIFLGCSAYIEASLFIWKVAKEQHNTTPTRLLINLGKWTDFSIFENPNHGCPHAEIEIKNQRYIWSFEQRDFVKAKENLTRCY